MLQVAKFWFYVNVYNEKVCIAIVLLYLGPAYGQYSVKFILPEFVSHLGNRGVMCVGNGSHSCTPVLMNMCNITFQVFRLSTFVFNKCSEKNSHDYIYS